LEFGDDDFLLGIIITLSCCDGETLLVESKSVKKSNHHKQNLEKNNKQLHLSSADF